MMSHGYHRMGHYADDVDVNNLYIYYFRKGYEEMKCIFSHSFCCK